MFGEAYFKYYVACINNGREGHYDKFRIEFTENASHVIRKYITHFIKMVTVYTLKNITQMIRPHHVNDAMLFLIIDGGKSDFTDETIRRINHDIAFKNIDINSYVFLRSVGFDKQYDVYGHFGKKKEIIKEITRIVEETIEMSLGKDFVEGPSKLRGQATLSNILLMYIFKQLLYLVHITEDSTVIKQSGKKVKIINSRLIIDIVSKNPEFKNLDTALGSFNILGKCIDDDDNDA